MFLRTLSRKQRLLSSVTTCRRTTCLFKSQTTKTATTTSQTHNFYTSKTNHLHQQQQQEVKQQSPKFAATNVNVLEEDGINSHYEQQVHQQQINIMNNNTTAATEQQEQQQQQQQQQDSNESDILMESTEDLFNVEEEHAKAIQSEYERYRDFGWPEHVKLFLKRIEGNVAAILEGKDLVDRTGLYFTRGGITILDYRPLPSASYYHEWYCAPSYTMKSKENPQQMRWRAHKYALDEYRYFILKAKAYGILSDKDHVFLMMHMTQAYPDVYKFSLVDYNQVLNSCRGLKRSDILSLPAGNFRTIIASHFIKEMLAQRIDPDTCTFNTLLALYVDTKGVEIVSKLLFLMAKLQVKIDMITYTSLMDYLAIHPQKEKVEQVYREMRAAFPVIDQQAYVSTLAAALKSKHFDLLHEVFLSMNREFPRLNFMAANSMIVACVEEGQFEMAERIFQENLTKDRNYIDISSINCLLKLHQRSGSPKVVDLFNNMESQYGVVPDHYSVGILIHYLLEKGDYNAVEKTYRDEVARGAAYNEVLNNLMARCYSERGDADKLLDLFEEIKGINGPISNNFLQYMFRVFSLAGRTKEMLDMYFDVDNEQHVLPILDEQFANVVLSYITSMSQDINTKAEYLLKLWHKFDKHTVSHATARAIELNKRFMFWFLNFGHFEGGFQSFLKLQPYYKPNEGEQYPSGLFKVIQSLAEGSPTPAGFISSRYVYLPSDFIAFRQEFYYYLLGVFQSFSVEEALKIQKSSFASQPNK